MNVTKIAFVVSSIMCAAYFAYGVANLYWFIFTGDTLFHPNKDQVGWIVISGYVWAAVAFLTGIWVKR